jgi:hypothetical protein
MATFSQREKDKDMQCTKTAIVVIAIGTLGALGAATKESDWTTAKWNGKRIRYSAEGGQASVDTTPEEFRLRLDFPGDVTHNLVIKSDELLLSSDALGIEKPQRREFSGGVEVTVAATPDSLAVKILEEHSSSHSSESSSTSSDGSSTSTQRSSSSSTSHSSEVKCFEIVRWNDKTIELSLEGGNTVVTSVDQNDDHCTIKFNIDKGKSKQTLKLEPGVLTVNDKPQDISDGFTRLLISATRRTMKIKADDEIVGKWKNDRK